MPQLEGLYDQLKEAVLERYSSPSSSPGSAFVAFEFGTPIPDDTFRLQDPQRSLSDQLAAEFLSHHANTAPDVTDDFFQRSERTIDGQYGILLAGAKPTDSADIDLFEHVKSEAVERFDRVSHSFHGPQEYHPVVATPSNWFDPSASDNWSQVHISLEGAPPITPPPVIDPRLIKWKIAAEFLRPIIARDVTTETLRDFATATADRLSPVTTWSDDTLERNVFIRRSEGFRTTVEGGWARTAEEEEDLEEEEDTRISPLVEVGSIRDFQTVVGVATEEKHVEADSFVLDAEMCLVSIRRPWISDALLSLPSWYVHGFAQGTFASGATNYQGNIGLLPTACILIRNVVIRAHWSDSDRQIIRNAATLGALSLFGRRFDEGSAELKLQGMQSFAWVCEPLPVLPPNDPPQ